MTTKLSIADVRSKRHRASQCSPEDLIIYKMISTRARDYEDAMSVVHRQGDVLDDRYVIKWLRQFELALDDSTLVTQYQQWRNGSSPVKVI